MKLHTFHIEVTDTFGGEANYCWKREWLVKASSARGAIGILARKEGSGWRKAWGDFDSARYDLQGACICCFVSYVDPGESIFNDIKYL